jgi:hypothetical protein
MKPMVLLFALCALMGALGACTIREEKVVEHRPAADPAVAPVPEHTTTTTTRIGI